MSVAQSLAVAAAALVMSYAAAPPAALSPALEHASALADRAHFAAELLVLDLAGRVMPAPC